MIIRTWNIHPLSTEIAEVLQRKGPLTDVDLYNTLKDRNDRLGFETLNQTLLRMEIGGTIHVTAFTKGKRRVALVEPQGKAASSR